MPGKDARATRNVQDVRALLDTGSLNEVFRPLLKQRWNEEFFISMSRFDQFLRYLLMHRLRHYMGFLELAPFACHPARLLSLRFFEPTNVPTGG